MEVYLRTCQNELQRKKKARTKKKNLCKLFSCENWCLLEKRVDEMKRLNIISEFCSHSFFVYHTLLHKLSNWRAPNYSKSGQRQLVRCNGPNCNILVAVGAKICQGDVYPKFKKYIKFSEVSTAQNRRAPKDKQVCYPQIIIANGYWPYLGVSRRSGAGKTHTPERVRVCARGKVK